eukprot:maker-scaffold_11-augustus-gene-5.4-mRNA-1 protein AED:0.37 eAED:0.37 QI:0/0/0/0.5/1/1/2/0/829
MNFSEAFLLGSKVPVQFKIPIIFPNPPKQRVSAEKLLGSTRLLRQLGRWKELVDLKTRIVYYYHISKKETFIYPPYQFLQTFICDWKDCTAECDSLLGFLRHRNTHKWRCQGCFQLNLISKFPACTFCGSELDSAGVFLGSAESPKVVPGRDDFNFSVKEAQSQPVNTNRHAKKTSLVRTQAKELFEKESLRVLKIQSMIVHGKEYKVLKIRGELSINQLEELYFDLIRNGFGTRQYSYGYYQGMLKSGKPETETVSSKNELACRKEKASKDSTFFGEFKGGLKHGFGVYFCFNKDFFCLPGEEESAIREKCCSCNHIYFGYWENGRRNGTGTIICEHGDVLISSFEEGNPHGRGLYLSLENGSFNVNPAVRAFLTFEAGKVTGQIICETFQLDKTQFFSGNVVNSIPSGGFLYNGTSKLTNVEFCGSCEEGFAEGRCRLKIKTPDNDMKFVGSFFRGRFYSRVNECCFLSVDTFASSTKYFGGFKQGNRSGFGVQKSADFLYFGSFALNKFHGIGTLYTCGLKYSGTFLRGLKSGYGLENIKPTRNTACEKSFKGYFKNNERLGYGVLTYYDGKIYVGSFSEGLKHGKGKLMFKNGDIYKGEFNKGKLSGFAEISLNNGISYSGAVWHSLYHGNGRLTCTRLTFEGEFIKGDMRKGKMILFPSSALEEIYEGELHSGKLHGHGTFWYRDGSVYVGKFCKGKKHGKGKIQYAGLRSDNIVLYEGDFHCGRMTGFGVVSYSTGEKYTGHVKNGIREGNGVLLYTQFFKSMRYEGQFKENRFHGKGEITNLETKEIYRGEFEKGTRFSTGASQIIVDSKSKRKIKLKVLAF